MSLHLFFHQHQQDWSHLVPSPLRPSLHPRLLRCGPSAKWPPPFLKRPPLTSRQSPTKLQARPRSPKPPPARVRELASSCFHCSVSTCPQMARKQNREGFVWSQIAHCSSHDIAENGSLSFPDAAWCPFNPPRVISCAVFFCVWCSQEMTFLQLLSTKQDKACWHAFVLTPLTLSSWYNAWN